MLDIILKASEQGDRAFCMWADPALVDLLEGDGVQMVPTLPSTPDGDDQFRLFQHPQMLHHRAAVELGKMRAERAGGQRLVPQIVEDLAADRRGQGFENAVVPVGD